MKCLIKVAAGLILALSIAGCSDNAPEVKEAKAKEGVESIVKEPLAQPPMTKHDISRQYMSCYAYNNDADLCEKLCAEEHGFSVCNDIDNKYKVFTKSPRHIKNWNEASAPERLAREDYMACVFSGADDDTCEVYCSDLMGHGKAVCDKVEDEFEYATDKDNSLNKVAAAVVTAAILSDNSGSDHRKQNRVVQVTPTIDQNMNRNVIGRPVSNVKLVTPTTTKPNKRKVVGGPIIAKPGAITTTVTTATKKAVDSKASKPAKVELNKPKVVIKKPAAVKPVVENKKPGTVSLKKESVKAVITTKVSASKASNTTVKKTIPKKKNQKKK